MRSASASKKLSRSPSSDGRLRTTVVRVIIEEWASSMGLPEEADPAGPCLERLVQKLESTFHHARSHDRDEFRYLLAAVVSKAGGHVRLTERNMVDAFGLDLEQSDDAATGERLYRTSLKP